MRTALALASVVLARNFFEELWRTSQYGSRRRSPPLLLIRSTVPSLRCGAGVGAGVDRSRSRSQPTDSLPRFRSRTCLHVLRRADTAS
jgi:hypothetical protein